MLNMIGTRVGAACNDVVSYGQMQESCKHGCLSEENAHVLGRSPHVGRGIDIRERLTGIAPATCFVLARRRRRRGIKIVGNTLQTEGNFIAWKDSSSLGVSWPELRQTAIYRCV